MAALPLATSPSVSSRSSFVPVSFLSLLEEMKGFSSDMHIHKRFSHLSGHKICFLLTQDQRDGLGGK